MDEQEYEVVPLGNPFTHDRTGFCVDGSCGCHEDPDLIGEVNEMYQDGLLSADDATRRVRGWTL